MYRENGPSMENQAEVHDLGTMDQVREGAQARIDELEAAILVEPNHQRLVELTQELRALRTGKKDLKSESIN